MAQEAISETRVCIIILRYFYFNFYFIAGSGEERINKGATPVRFACRGKGQFAQLGPGPLINIHGAREWFLIVIV